MASLSEQETLGLPRAPQAFTCCLTSSFYKMALRARQASLLHRGKLRMKITFRIPSFAAQVVIESDLYTTRPLELLPHRSERRDGEARRPGRFQNARQQGPHPAKTPTRPGTCVAARVPGTALGGTGPLRAAATVSTSPQWSALASSGAPRGACAAPALTARALGPRRAAPAKPLLP